MRDVRFPVLAITVLVSLAAGGARAAAPYPRSGLVTGLTWDTATYRSGGRGGDIWPVTWGQDGRVYTAWGDGAVVCPAYVSYGTAAIAGGPSATLATLGCGPLGPRHGKLRSLLEVAGTLYAVANLQDRPTFPDVAVWASPDHGAAWLTPAWTFTGAGGSPQPVGFVNFGPGYAGARDGFVYLTAVRPVAKPLRVFLLRAPAGKPQDQASYEYLTGTDATGAPTWGTDPAAAHAVFRDPGGVYGPRIVYDAALGRYLLTAAHGDGSGGRIGLFEGPAPWGPWRTVDYEDAWLGMAGGENLGIGLPTAWMSADGRTLWAVFSCYGLPGCGVYHDRFNLMRATLTLAPARR